MASKAAAALQRQNIVHKLKSRQKEKIALELLIAGGTYDQIAKEMGYHDRSGARKAVKRALAIVNEEAASLAAETKTVILERNSRLIQTVWPLAMGREAVGEKGKHGYQPPVLPDYRAIDRIVEIQAQLAELLGLNAPKELRHAGAGGGAIEVSDVRTKLAGLLAGVGPVDPANDSREAISEALRRRT